jgi:hypothetical protein
VQTSKNWAVPVVKLILLAGSGESDDAAVR